MGMNALILAKKEEEKKKCSAHQLLAQGFSLRELIYYLMCTSYMSFSDLPAISH